MKYNNFTGTGVAIVTPLNNDFSIDYNSLETLIEHLISNNINYIVVLGTTGESVTLSKTEKTELTDYIKRKVNNRVPLVLGIGGNNTSEIINTINNTNFTGIDAILSVSPYYNKPTQKGLYEHYKAISEACPVPIILYNVPGRTGSNIKTETTIQLAKNFENIIAIKEASGDLCQMMQIIKNKPKDFLVISGDDSLTLPLLAAGGNGLISVAANAFPKKMSELVNSALKNNMDTARKINYQLIDLFDLLFVDGNPAGIKTALNILGITKTNVRLPLVPASESTYKKIKEVISNLK